MPSRLQVWVENIPTRMQGTLILGLRGPDTHTAPGIKVICRWLRGLAFKPGNPTEFKTFMGGTPPRIVEKDSVAKELEFCSQHFYSHLMHALEVVAYRHPSEDVATHAFGLFQDMTGLMHLPVESRQDFEHRLRELEWPNGERPEDYFAAERIS